MFRNPPLHRQQNQTDCGVACLLSVIQYYKGFNNIENLRRLSGTGVNGTTLLGLYEAATKVGFNAAGCQASISDLLDHKQPVILHVVLSGNLQHYVVCFNYKINKLGVVQFQIGDPAQGIMYLSETELNAIWQSKTCLTLEPNERFVTASKSRKEKLLWFFRILREDIPHLGVAAVLGILIAAMSLSMAVFSQKLIDDFLPGRLSDKIYTGVLLVGIILLIRESISAVRQWLLLQQLRSFNSRIIQYFFSRLLQLPMPFFDTRKIGDLTARLNDTTRIQRVVTQIFGTALIEVLVIVVTLIFLFRYSVNIALLTLFFLPFFFGLAYLHRRQVLKGQQHVMQGYAFTEANYISTVQGISAIRNHNQLDYFISLNKQVYGGYQSAILDMGKLQIRISLFASVSSIIFLMLLLTYGSSLVLSGQLKTGELIAIVSLIGSMLPGVSGLALLSIPLSEAMVAINRMFEFTSIEIEDEKDNEIGTHLIIQSVSVQNLSFRYPGRLPLLKSINLQISKGQMIGLIGENGSGKSTLVQLLLKHYRPEAGNVTINYENDFHSIPGYIWRRYCSVVPQQVHIFNSTVLQNIAFEDAERNSTEVLAFLNMHGFTPLFKMLPEGINSLAGDEGINLSGGQRQLVGIARALYARPQILILDEATSAMDMETEQFVLSLLNKFLPDLSILCITHRLHILRYNCERIYVMQQGVITTYGNHSELMVSTNLYSNYWNQILKEAKDLPN